MLHVSQLDACDVTHRVGTQDKRRRPRPLKTSSEVTADKLRGGFYSPEPLVRVCLDRASALLKGDGPLRALEPSAGDGGFLAGLARHKLGSRVTWVTAVEIVDKE